MKIGIIVHSHTGNTLSVAEKLQVKLGAAGHVVNIERLLIIGEGKPGTKGIRFESLPDTSSYDALVFGAPVQAFSLSSVMQTYLGQAETLQGKKVAMLLTQHFPYAWMGGNRALGQLRMACKTKGAVICGAGIVHWSKAGREKQIEEVIGTLSQSLS